MWRKYDPERPETQRGPLARAEHGPNVARDRGERVSFILNKLPWRERVLRRNCVNNTLVVVRNIYNP